MKPTKEAVIRKPQKVAVGLSGGVDSSVAAHILQEQGYDVTGVFMTCWDAKADGCRADEDREDAVKVAAKLGIKFTSLDFITQYKSKVIEYFYREYAAGRTPNPDVMCNKEIKFGLFLEWALAHGYDKIATGHYARVVGKKNGEEGTYKLLKGVDSTKDQSYFLYLLSQKALSHTLFPLGGLVKEQVRELAKTAGLHTFNKPDSVGICFIGEVDIKDFLQKVIPPNPGLVVNTAGEVLGEHDGVAYYTIGQRHGFRVTKYVGLPLYVLAKNTSKNELVVGFAGEANKIEFEVEQLHWLAETSPPVPLDCTVRIRHLGELYACSLTKQAKQADMRLTVNLTDAVFGISPGQSAVFYSGDEVLGGGIIV